MSGFYRIGNPGEDTMTHINTGIRSSGPCCIMDRFPEDNSQWGPACGRMSVALCDAPGCDKPICSLHRHRHATTYNTDLCTRPRISGARREASRRRRQRQMSEFNYNQCRSESRTCPYCQQSFNPPTPNTVVCRKKECKLAHKNKRQARVKAKTAGRKL